MAKAGKFEVKDEISSIIYSVFVFHSPGSPEKLGGKVYICIYVQEPYAA